MNRTECATCAAILVEAGVERSAPLPRLIAGLSLCMLTASLGAMVGPVWSRCWAIFGLLGLASALGLDVLNRSCAARADRQRRKRIAMKTERMLAETVEETECSCTIRAALRQFQHGAPGPNDHAEPRFPLNRPATITSLFRSSVEPGYELGQPLAGRVRTISRHGVGLTHDQRLERGIVLLECAAESGQPLQFVVEVLWCEPQDGSGYSSGGRILDVMGPCDAQPACIP